MQDSGIIWGSSIFKHCLYDRKHHHRHQSISITTNLIPIIIRRHREDLDALMGGTLETLVMFEKDCMSEYTANVIITHYHHIIITSYHHNCAS